MFTPETPSEACQKAPAEAANLRKAGQRISIVSNSSNKKQTRSERVRSSLLLCTEIKI